MQNGFTCHIWGRKGFVLILFTGLLFIFAGCSSDNNSSANQGVDILVAGTISISGKDYAVLWENGDLQYLQESADGINSSATAIRLNGSDV